MRNILFFFILLIFSTCKKGEYNTDKTVSGNAIKSEKLITFEDVLVDTMLFENFSIIPLETNEENLLQSIGRIIIKDERIYIFDDRLYKICIFNKNGAYLNQIHQIGQGPEEYISIMDFCLDEKNNELLVLCDRPYKLMRFSINGDFIKQTTYTELYKEISIDADFLFCTLSYDEEHEIGCFNSMLQPIYKKLVARKKTNTECHNIGHYLVKSKYLNYTRRFDPSLYRLSLNGIEKIYEFDFGRYILPKEIAYEKRCDSFFKICQEEKYIYSITNAVESNDHILFNTNLGICLYDKRTNNLTGYSAIYNSSINFVTSLIYPNEGSENTIIMLIEPFSLTYYKENSIKTNPILNDLVEKVKLDDNPILIFYET